MEKSLIKKTINDMKMKKKVSKAFGKKQYLLGSDEYGNFYWLEEAKFDCGWYWGGGYVETFTNNQNPARAKDIQSHHHFDEMFLDNGHCDTFKKFFVHTPLSDTEIWRLLELMKSFYIAREYSDMIYRGGAHISNNLVSVTIQSETEYKRINEVVIPAIMNAVYEILGGENE